MAHLAWASGGGKEERQAIAGSPPGDRPATAAPEQRRKGEALRHGEPRPGVKTRTTRTILRPFGGGVNFTPTQCRPMRRGSAANRGCGEKGRKAGTPAG